MNRQCSGLSAGLACRACSSWSSSRVHKSGRATRSTDLADSLGARSRLRSTCGKRGQRRTAVVKDTILWGRTCESDFLVQAASTRSIAARTASTSPSARPNRPGRCCWRRASLARPVRFSAACRVSAARCAVPQSAWLLDAGACAGIATSRVAVAQRHSQPAPAFSQVPHISDISPAAPPSVGVSRSSDHACT